MIKFSILSLVAFQIYEWGFTSAIVKTEQISEKIIIWKFSENLQVFLRAMFKIARFKFQFWELCVFKTSAHGQEASAFEKLWKLYYQRKFVEFFLIYLESFLLGTTKIPVQKWAEFASYNFLSISAHECFLQMK